MRTAIAPAAAVPAGRPARHRPKRQIAPILSACVARNWLVGKSTPYLAWLAPSRLHIVALGAVAARRPALIVVAIL